LEALGFTSDAKSFVEEAVDILERTLGSTSPDFATIALVNLAIFRRDAEVLHICF
jgi:hypothetical protein